MPLEARSRSPGAPSEDAQGDLLGFRSSAMSGVVGLNGSKSRSLVESALDFDPGTPMRLHAGQAVSIHVNRNGLKPLQGLHTQCQDQKWDNVRSILKARPHIQELGVSAGWVRVCSKFGCPFHKGHPLLDWGSRGHLKNPLIWV